MAMDIGWRDSVAAPRIGREKSAFPQEPSEAAE
jgi:hypothetical protein